jgi:hypothetical protein
LILQEFVDSTHIQFGDDLYVYHEMFRLFFLSDELEVSEKVLKLIEVQHFQLTDAQMEHNILNLIVTSIIQRDSCKSRSQTYTTANSD